jgi:hypothetical protein
MTLQHCLLITLAYLKILMNGMGILVRPIEDDYGVILIN